MKHFWLLACCAVALSGAIGCASTGGSGPLASFARKAKAKPADSTLAQQPAAAAKAPETKTADTKPAETAATPTAAAPDSANPFRKPTELAAAAAAAATPAAGPVGTPAPIVQTVAKVETPAVPSAAPGSLNFRPEVLALIDAELRDASPDEKASWYDQLKKVDPALVPELLRVRRLSIQIAERNTQADEALLAAAARPSTPAAGGYSAATTSDWDRGAMEHPLPAAQLNSVEPEFDEHSAFPADKIQQANHTPVDDAPGVVHAVGEFSDPTAARSVQPVMHQVDDPAESANAVSLAGIEPVAGPPTNRRRAPQTVAFGPTRPVASGKTSAPLGGHTVLASSSQANAPGRISQAVGVGEPTPGWDNDLDQLIAQAEQEVATLQPGTTPESKHEYLRKHVYLRMLYLMAHHPERALTAVPEIDSADQEFVQQLFWGVSNYLDSEHIPSERDRASQTLSQLQNAAQRLRDKSDLEIHNLAFCEQIQYFGNYQRFPRDEFSPGQETLLYAELQNFRSEATGDGQFRTVLRSKIEILGPAGEVRWEKPFPATEDLCRTPRRDYFHNYQFAIPNSLPLGPHTLKLTVFDELSGKIASYTLNFLVR